LPSSSLPSQCSRSAEFYVGEQTIGRSGKISFSARELWQAEQLDRKAEMLKEHNLIARRREEFVSDALREGRVYYKQAMVNHDKEFGLNVSDSPKKCTM
jgi:hypothetical protein